MPSNLPSLNALRAFEAAAQHLSFTKAAKALHVTQGAISHQVKNLESELGLLLFERHPRQLSLTPAGQNLSQACRLAFDGLATTIEQLKRQPKAGVLTVSLPPSLAVRWLMPRLNLFTEQHPNIDLRLSASDRLVDFEAASVDMAIRYGLGPYPGLSSEVLLQDEVYPVCAPQLLSGPQGLKYPGDLEFQTLLEDSVLRDHPNRPSWHKWLRIAGVAHLRPTGQRVFGHADLVLQAAIRGLGVALGRSTLVQEDLAAGRLVRPFALSYRSDFSYHIVVPDGLRHQPKVQLFCQWLREQAQAAMPPE